MLCSDCMTQVTDRLAKQHHTYPSFSVSSFALRGLLKDAVSLAGALTDETPFVFDLPTYEPQSKQEIEAATLKLVLKNHSASKLLAGPHCVRPRVVNISKLSGLLVMKHWVTALAEPRRCRCTKATPSARLDVVDIDLVALPMEKFGSWKIIPSGPAGKSCLEALCYELIFKKVEDLCSNLDDVEPDELVERKKQPVPDALWSHEPFFAAVRKHALAEIAKGGPDEGQGPTDALTKLWPMALRNDKEIILAGLAATRQHPQAVNGALRLAGESLRSDPDILAAFAPWKDAHDDAEAGASVDREP